MLVDNAIVMSESIMVQMAAGKERLRAAVDSANELRIPLLTSSLTTAAAFLPIILAESGLGEYCASLFKVVTIALLISWGLSITMMLLLCMLFIKIKTKAKGDEIIPIVLRSVAADRQDIGKLAGLNVYVQSSGESVPLQQIADARVVWESSKIITPRPQSHRYRPMRFGAGGQCHGDREFNRILAGKGKCLLAYRLCIRNRRRV
jgi:multidrug efflux pump subunit AcrB